MADRYFIGGSGAKNWNDTANWSTSSGGSGGASVPTSSDNVYFDALSLSDTCTLTLDAEVNCLDLDMTGLDESLIITSSVYCMNIYGSMILNSNFTATFSGTAYLYFKATTSETITSNSATQSWNKIYFDGVGGEWTNQDNWDISECFVTFSSKTSNEWDTNSKEIKVKDFYSAVSGTNTLTLGSSDFYYRSWRTDYSSTLILNAGTSTLHFTANDGYLIRSNDNMTFYNVQTDTPIVANCRITGTGHTFNNLIAIGTNDRRFTVYFHGSNTINGTLTVTGYNSTTRRALVCSYFLGTAQTLTAANTAITNCDFRDIVGAGAGDWDFSSDEIGDCGGNSGITFRAGENRYYYEGTGNLHDAKWYSATGGGGDAKTMPLPQDTAIFDANSFSGSATLTIDNVRIGSLDMSAVDEAVTLEFGLNVECYGDFILGENITLDHDNKVLYCYGREEYNFDSKDEFLYEVRFGADVNSKYTINHNIIGRRVSLDNGVLDFNDYDIDLSGGWLTINAPGKLYMGDGLITLYGYSSYLISDSLNFLSSGGEFHPENSTIKCVNDVERNIEGRGYDMEFNNVWVTNSPVIFEGNHTINDLKIDAGKTVKFKAGRTQTINSLTVIGTSENPITITSETAAQHTLSCTSGNIICDYLDLSYSIATGGATFWAGANSTDNGNNTGWIFATPEFISSVAFTEIEALTASAISGAMMQASMTESEVLTSLLIADSFLSSAFTEIETLESILSCKVFSSVAFTESEELISELALKTYLQSSMIEQEDLSSILSAKAMMPINFTEIEEMQVAGVGGGIILFTTFTESESLAIGQTLVNVYIEVNLDDEETLESVLSVKWFISIAYTEREEMLTLLSWFIITEILLGVSELTPVLTGESELTPVLTGVSELI